MNIGIFTDTYKPHINGVVTSIENKKIELEKMGHTVYIVAPKEPGYVDEEHNVYRLPSFKLIFQPEYRLANPLSRKILKKFKTSNLDVIHIETPFSMGLIGKAVGRKLKIPIIHTYHTLFPEYVHYLRLPVKITKPIAEKISSYFCNRCDHIISPSTDVANQLKSYGVKRPITIIPSSISFDTKHHSSGHLVRAEYCIDDNEKILLFVGRLGKEKNIEFLIKSFKKLVENNKFNYRFLIVGDGPHKNKLKAKIKEFHLEDKTIFAGYIKNTEVYKYYSASDMFIFSSLTETQGLVVLEAMFCGTPVVAVKASGVEDTIENGVSGYLTKNDINDFTSKIENVFSNKELLENFVINGRKRATDFSPENTFKRVIRIYKKHSRYNKIKKIKDDRKFSILSFFRKRV